MNIDWAMLGWVLGAILLSNAAVLYTGYRYYHNMIESIDYIINDLKIIHCEKCGRPEIVSKDLVRLKTCDFCTGHYCEHCDEVHRIEDDGYKIKVKKSMDSKKKVV